MGEKKISINVQGLSRRDIEQQKCFAADEGQVFVFTDLRSAEPTILANYSKDPNYLAATLHMIGKRPYYNKDGLLMISCPYIMIASVFPKWAKEIRDVFESTDYPGGVSGFDYWVIDDDHVKKKVKKRNNAKSLALAIVYGMGAKHMVEKANKEKFELAMSEAKEFKNLFWKTFKQAKILGDKLASMYTAVGHLENEFGYVVYPSADYKCLNAIIQSTVSGLIDWFSMMFFARCKEAAFVTVIHDELLFSIPTERESDIKKLFYKVQDELNSQLGWEAPVSFGWTTSNTWAIK